MIWNFIPYSFEKKMFEAWDRYMDIVHDPEDWVCMQDGDVMWPFPDFNHKMKEYIDAYPETGIFSTYASRAHRQEYIRKGVDMGNPSILYHYDEAEKCRNTLHLKVKPIIKPALGHVILMKKATWLLIREKVKERTKNYKILSVDVSISKEVTALGMPVILMRSLYVIHFFRMKHGLSERSMIL